MKVIYNKYKVHFWLTLVIIQQLVLLLVFNGTGDDGDSVNHYLHNRYAFVHPWLFIHLWAKPVFVFASCLFAQLGFIGIKLFNSIAAISAAYIAYRLAKQLGIREAELCIPFLMFMPRYLHHSLSGLTEPLFSLLAVSSLFLLTKDKNKWAALLISLLPFSRPEGLYFIAIAGLYFLVHKKLWKYIPLLLVGHIFISLVGILFFKEDWLWVFTKNPNATLDPAYGVTGGWLHYVRGSRDLFGLPICGLFWMGCVVLSVKVSYNIKNLKSQSHTLVLLASIFIVIVSHTVFWKFGLFKSLGLIRNILTISPLAAIVAVVGFGWILSLIENIRAYYRIKWLIIILAFTFLYSGSNHTFKIPIDFQLEAQQLQAEKVVEYINDSFPRTLMKYYLYPHLSVAFNQDPFEWGKYKGLDASVIEKPMSGNTILIWDEWYAKMEGKVSLELMHKNNEIEHVKSFSVKDKWGKERRLEVFKSKVWE